ncbi:MAG: hypothetical protein A3F14_06535 [Gammaproteobacteria bacterium RIFCSPHIGHO2_12_FULL_43_28]|nr:MAG: hypothetical protein A3F14_06535 [Gammaproteobacteria bacterium RIFCSPHIGHO2_12_FULL_43_28]
MALDLSKMFSKLNFLRKLDARARVFFLLAAIVGVVILVYVGTQFFAGGAETTGPSRIAGAPSGLESVPGGELTPEYQRALEEANVQRAQQARISGTTAVPTQIRYGAGAGGDQCIICADDAADVKYNLDEWVRQGKVSPEVANQLKQFANSNPSVSEYAAMLDQLVKEGKLTPEQARALLDAYKKQHANAQLVESAKTLDALIKSGDLPVDVANQLLEAQKENVSPADYAKQLQDLVKQGKISPEVAQRLLAEYTQQRAKEIIMRSITSLKQLAQAGQITADVEKALIELEMQMVPVATYAAALQRFISQGKLVPAVAAKILDEFQGQKDEIGPTASLNQQLQQAEDAAYGELRDLVKAGKITQAVATQLAGLIQQDIPPNDYKKIIDQLVVERKLTPDIAKLKMADYQEVKRLRELMRRLGALQSQNASVAAYADALKQTVQAGLLSPDEAERLLREYEASTSRIGPAVERGAVPADFAQLQQRVEAGAVTPGVDFGTAAVPDEQALARLEQERQARIQNLASAMSGQAQQLVSSWQPAEMQHTQGSADDAAAAGGGVTAVSGPGSATSSIGTPPAGLSGPSLIKAGSILFAVLDTAVNSDYPDSPVLATVVAGDYKGAKLLGKLTTTKSVSGQLDRVSLNFTLMNLDAWPKAKAVTAYAIDPDTARTVLASEVNYHYLQRFGAIMATSFLQGYATGITNEGTSTTGIFGTSTTTPALSPGNKIAVALGQIGQTLGSVTQNYVDIPPTVKVDAGVGLGILFASDVS